MCKKLKPVERYLHLKDGGDPTYPAVLMLEGLAVLLKTKELPGQKFPRGHFPGRSVIPHR